VNAFYLRIIMYAIFAAALFGGGWVVNGWRLSAQIAEIKTQDAQSSEKARRDADTANVLIAAAYNAKLTATEQIYETQLATGRAAADRLIASLRNYQNKLRNGTVPAGADAPGAVHATSSEPGSDSGIAEAARRAIEACESDAAALTGLQAERASLNK